MKPLRDARFRGLPPLTLLIGALLLSTGCAGIGDYVEDRADDLSDIARFHAAVGQVGLYAEVEATAFLKPAVGFADFRLFPEYSAGWHPHRDDYDAQVRTAAFPGLLVAWPYYGWRESQEGYGDTHPYWRGFIAPLILMGNDHIQETSHSLFMLHALIPNPRLQPDRALPSSHPVADRYWVGASATAGVFALGAGVNLPETLDFLAGLVGWDPMKDDYRDEVPVDVPEATGEPARSEEGDS